MFVPVLLIWIFALLLALLMLPLLAITAIFRPRAVWAMLKTIGHFAVLFSKTRGLHVEIHNAHNDILLYHR